MKITIKKGTHSANILQRLMQFGIHHDKNVMVKVVEFDITAKYDHSGTSDDGDVNKLFGFGYFNGGHHKDSARFGWTWDIQHGKVNLFSYCYVNGKRIMERLCQVAINCKYLLLIEIVDSCYSFTVVDGKKGYLVYSKTDVPFTHKKKWSYKLGCFFGGNNPAPHDITIKISNK